MGDNSPRFTEHKDADLLFIDHQASSKQQLSRIVSHARRKQVSRKRNQQHDSAKQNAGYARSLVGWRLPLVPRSKATVRINATASFDIAPESFLPYNTRTESDEIYSQRLQHVVNSSILTPVDTGLRADPFQAFPTDNSREAMHMIDFVSIPFSSCGLISTPPLMARIQVWSQYKRGATDVFLGLNTQIDVCWPIALQNAMLFDATLAVSRTAYCLGHKKRPNDDPFMLQHKIQALNKLRHELQSAADGPTEAVIFTVSRMLSVSYMTLDSASFEIHFAALQQITQQYMGRKSENNELARVVESRVRVWTPLLEYRHHDPTESYVELVARRSVPATILAAPLLADLHNDVYMLPEGFARLALEGSISTQVLHVLTALRRLLSIMDAATDTAKTSGGASEQLIHLEEQILALLDGHELSNFETQLCHALLGLAVSLSAVYFPTPGDVTHVSRTAPSILASDPPLLLERTVKAFLYLKYAGALQSADYSQCLQWAALVLGCCCFLVSYSGSHARQKGHITLVSIKERRRSAGIDDGWEALEAELRPRFFWPDKLSSGWNRIYLDAVHRQNEWESLGLLSIGMPSSDKIEYLVLGDARGSLPLIP